MKRAVLFLCAFILLLSNCAVALTFEDRVESQRAIEQVYYSHRIWPSGNPGAKPPFETLLNENLLRTKVEDALLKSGALEHYWRRPITAWQLQAEIDRMARESKDPSVLRELFAALHNDPRLVAECLARPLVADRLIHNWYAYDDRFHGGLRRQVQSELAMTNTVEAMRALSGRYSEVTSEAEQGGTRSPAPDPTGVFTLDPGQWKAFQDRLSKQIGNLPVLTISSLKEDANRFYVNAILEKGNTRVRLATVEWKKQSFEEWWRNAKLQTSAEVPLAEGAYTLRAPAALAGDTWTATEIGPGPGRDRHTAVWTGAEMIIWGGMYDDNSLPERGRLYIPATDTWNETTSGPVSRYGQSAVWTGSEMIVWGGSPGVGALNDGGRYNPVSDSWTFPTTSSAPAARVWHTAVWTGAEMIVWGGWDNAYNEINTGGRYNPTTNTWAAGGVTTTNAPTARLWHTAVWTGSEMIIWGGQDSGTLYIAGGKYNPNTNTWAVGGTTTTNAPAARIYHSAVWTGTEMIVWGGATTSGSESTGGRYNPSTDSWSATTTTGAPAGRSDHTAVWTGNEMIVWGGDDGTLCYQDGGRYNPATNNWATMSTVNAPDTRYQHTVVWTGTEMIVWGGLHDIDVPILLSSGGRYNPTSDTWVPTSNTSAPTPRYHHTAVWTGAEMIIWGGFDFDEFSTGGRYFPATNTWAPVGTSQTGAPNKRYSHTAIWTGLEMIVWGGWDGEVSYWADTGGRYNPTTNAWVAGGTSVTNAPTPRSDHTAVWTGQMMIIWGGGSGPEKDTGGRYDPASNFWWVPAISLVNAPSPRRYHTAVWTGSEMIIWGGLSLGSYNTGGRYNPTTNTWFAGGTDITTAPSARYAHTAVWTGKEMIVWGGWNSLNFFNDGARYSPLTNTWTATATTGAPTWRRDHTSVWTGKEVIVWGGYDPSGHTNTGGRYNACKDTWAPGGTSTSAAPPDRTLATGVWTGKTMIVWGGENLVNSLSSGGLYSPYHLSDHFDDNVLDSGWTYLKPAWSESSHNLVATPTRKAVAIATGFTGCQVCSVEADVQSSGGVGNKIWLLGWYKDKNNTMELLIKEENNKIILRQRSGGVIVKKQAVPTPIDPNTTYDMKISFDGTKFVVSVNCVDVMTFVPAAAVPIGTIGLQVKKTTARFDSIYVQ